MPAARVTGICSLEGSTASEATTSGVERSGFRRIDRGADRADFAQTHLRDRIEQAGIDLQALAVDHLRARGDFDGGSDIGDFAVLDHNRAIVDAGAGESEDFGVGDGVGG